MIGTGFVKLTVAAAIGAGVAYLFDPDRGRARRARLRDQTRATVRRDVRAVGRVAHYNRGRVEGLRHRIGNNQHVTPASDQVVADKVRSEVFGRMHAIAQHVNLDVSNGVVTLRGQLDDQADIDRLGAAVRRVAGVSDVVNLVHRPGEVAPNKADVLRATG